MNSLDLLAVQGTLKSLLQHHSSKASILQRSAFFAVHLWHPYMTTGKTIALTRRTFVGKVMSLLLNMLFRLIITLLPRSVILFHGCSHHLQCFWSPEKWSQPLFPHILCHEVMGSDATILVFWMLSLKPTFSLSSFTFKRIFNSSLCAISLVSSAYLRLLIFLPAILILACASSSPVFLMKYSAYKLNKQGDNIQPWCPPFPIWNQSVPCPVLTVASWPAYRFLKRQVSQSLRNWMKGCDYFWDTSGKTSVEILAVVVHSLNDVWFLCKMFASRDTLCEVFCCCVTNADLKRFWWEPVFRTM